MVSCSGTGEEKVSALEPKPSPKVETLHHVSMYHILNIVYITSLIVFLLSLIILIVFQRIVYSPLKKITDGAKSYANGDLKYEIKEIGRAHV